MGVNQGCPLLSLEDFQQKSQVPLQLSDSEPLGMASGHVETHLVLEGQARDKKPRQLGAREVWQALRLSPVSVHP